MNETLQMAWGVLKRIVIVSVVVYCALMSPILFVRKEALRDYEPFLGLGFISLMIWIAFQLYPLAKKLFPVARTYGEKAVEAGVDEIQHQKAKMSQKRKLAKLNQDMEALRKLKKALQEGLITDEMYWREKEKLTSNHSEANSPAS